MLALHGMRQARGFAALVAPWLAMPDDKRMHPTVAMGVALLLAVGLATVGHGGLTIVRDLTASSREAAP